MFSEIYVGIMSVLLLVGIVGLVSDCDAVVSWLRKKMTQRK